MRKSLVTANTFEPISLDEAKSFALRQTATGDDPYIRSLIVAARQAYETYTNRVLCASTWDLYLDDWDDPIELPGPLSSVTSVKYYDADEAEQTLSSTYYDVDTHREPGLITLAYGYSWPTIYDKPNAITVRFVSGYSDADDIPETIKHGMYLFLQEQYEGSEKWVNNDHVTRDGYEALWGADRIIPI